MFRLAIIGGMILKKMKILTGATPYKIKTNFGEVNLLVKDEVIFLLRHGKRGNIPPHRINHQANIASLKKLKIIHIIGINSVGSLKKMITPEYFLMPDDYINLWSLSTFYHKKCVHITPYLSEKLRQFLITTLGKLGEKYIKRGIYIQTIGPRLETKAEIKMLKNFGDVIGMTMANEATAAQELGLQYASLCSVDNFCHGISLTSLRDDQIKKNAESKIERLKFFFTEVIKKIR